MLQPIHFVGNVYIADTGSYRIFKVTTGTIYTISGSGTSASYSGDGEAATSATLSGLYGIAVDTSGSYFII